jgi:nitrogen fixation protein NifB
VNPYPYITVAGIAGPGDAFSEPDLTLQTLELIRRVHPHLSLCLSTNGLTAREHVESLKELDVGFITITVNAINPVVGARLYKSIRFEGRILRGVDAARVLIDRQLAAIAAFKAKGFVVKVNCVVASGINEDHVVFIAKRMGRMGVDLMNLIPLIALPGTDMAAVASPSASNMEKLRAKAGRYVPQMRHCARCRSDAAGLLNKSKCLDAGAAASGSLKVYET